MGTAPGFRKGKLAALGPASHIGTRGLPNFYKNMWLTLALGRSDIPERFLCIYPWTDMYPFHLHLSLGRMETRWLRATQQSQRRCGCLICSSLPRGFLSHPHVVQNLGSTFPLSHSWSSPEVKKNGWSDLKQ